MLWRHQLNHATHIVSDGAIGQINGHRVVFIAIQIEQAAIGLGLISCHVKPMAGDLTGKLGRRGDHSSVAAGHIILEESAFRENQVGAFI